MPRRNRFDLVLFDLDGTLADTAPDLAWALNQTLERHHRTTLEFDTIRPHVSHGGKALLRLGFGIEPEDSEYADLRNELLAAYLQNICRSTKLFHGMEQLLNAMERAAVAWGVVTNKPGWLTEPLMQQLRLVSRAACIVSGDTTANAKPHPEPLHHACRLAGIGPEKSLYVGDAERDIEAGRRAGMATLVASYGYIGEQDQPHRWNADGSVGHPLEILDWLHLPVPKTGQIPRQLQDIAK